MDGPYEARFSGWLNGNIGLSSATQVGAGHAMAQILLEASQRIRKPQSRNRCSEVMADAKSHLILPACLAQRFPLATSQFLV